MPNVTVNRSDRFPVGTEVGAYPLSSRHWGGKPSGAAAVSATVASNGSLTINLPEASVPYVLYAEVAGEHRYLNARSEAFAEPSAKQLERRALLRSSSGAGAPVVRVDELPTSSTKSPHFTGFASDTGTVTVKIYAGTKASGSVVTSATATPNGVGGYETGATAEALTAGTFTATAEQKSTLDPSAAATVSDPITFVVT